MAHEDIHRARESGSRQESGREIDCPHGLGGEHGGHQRLEERLTATMVWEERVEVTMGWDEKAMGSWLVEVGAKPHVSAMKRFWTRDRSQVSLCPTTCAPKNETENKVHSHSEAKARQNGALWPAMEIESAMEEALVGMNMCLVIMASLSACGVPHTGGGERRERRNQLHSLTYLLLHLTQYAAVQMWRAGDSFVGSRSPSTFMWVPGTRLNQQFAGHRLPNPPLC